MHYKASLAAVSVSLLALSTLPTQLFGAENAILQGRVSSNQQLGFDIYLPLQHRDQLERQLADLHNPSSPNYQKWLTPAEFNAIYAASSSQHRAIVAQLTSYGLDAHSVSAHRIHVTGTAAATERALGTVLKMGQFSSGKSTVAASKPLTMNGALLESHAVITAFSGTIHMRSHSQPVATPQNRYTPAGPYWFDDLKQAYRFPSFQSYTGKGATIGILMSGNFNPSDMDKYFAHEKLATPKFSTINVDGGSPFDPNSSFETHLDMQQSGGTAPEANVILYNLPDLSDTHIMDGLSQIITDNKVDIVNMSFGGAELYYTAAYNSGTDLTSVLRQEDDLFAQGNAQGITFIASSGDAGALAALPVSCAYAPVPNCGQFVASVEFPASSPHVTGVGGTNLVTTHSGIRGNLNSAYVREQAFADPLAGDIQFQTSATGGFWGSGGGDSILFSKPFFQNFVATGNDSFRTVPDLSLHMGGCPAGTVNNFCNPDDSADIEAIGGSYVGVIGTSASAPDFAGLTALAVERFGRRLGNENYYIYALAAAQYAGLPIKVYNKNIPGSNGLYSTNVKGYDRVLGNGTVNGTNFLLAPRGPVAGIPQTPSNP